jgi:hypothetical protein
MKKVFYIILISTVILLQLEFSFGLIRSMHDWVGARYEVPSIYISIVWIITWVYFGIRILFSIKKYVTKKVGGKKKTD